MPQELEPRDLTRRTPRVFLAGRRQRQIETDVGRGGGGWACPVPLAMFLSISHYALLCFVNASGCLAGSCLHFKKKGAKSTVSASSSSRNLCKKNYPPSIALYPGIFSLLHESPVGLCEAVDVVVIPFELASSTLSPPRATRSHLPPTAWNPYMPLVAVGPCEAADSSLPPTPQEELNLLLRHGCLTPNEHLAQRLAARTGTWRGGRQLRVVEHVRDVLRVVERAGDGLRRSAAARPS
jgi:hypothetical protein